MNKNSNLVIVLCVAVGFLGVCFLGGGIGLYLLFKSSGPEVATVKTSWEDVLKERVKLSDELTVEFQKVRDDNNGSIPHAERTRLTIKIRQHDDHLSALGQLATQNFGPPPVDVANAINRSLSTDFFMEFNRITPTKPPPTQIVGGPQMGGMPPGAYGPGAYPSGGYPPGAMPPGAVPFGGMPPGAMPRGSIPPGAGGFPSGAMPPNGLPPGVSPDGQIDVEAIEKMQKKAIAGMVTAEAMKLQKEEADRIKREIDSYHKNANPTEPLAKQPMVEAQRELVKQMLANELALRKKELTTEERLELYDKQSELEQSFREIGREEGNRLAAIKAEEDEKQRQQQELVQKQLIETVRQAREAQAKAMAKIDTERQREAAKIEEQHAARMAEINREKEERLKKQEYIQMMEAVNKQRAAKGLAPLNDLLKPITASIFDKEAAPGTEVKDTGDVKPKDKVFVHSAGKWHDAVVKTKRGKFVEVIHVALENTETVTVDRLRLQTKEPAKVAAKPAKADAPTAEPAPLNPLPPATEAVAAAPKPMEPAPANPFASIRTWSSSDGAFKVEAELVGFENGAAKLKRKDDGRVLNVPLDKLSADDQSIVRDIYPEK